MNELDPHIKIEWLGGNCPVQGEGTVGGELFYFRARGQRWSMSIGGDDVVGHPTWYYEEPFGEEEYVAGWMTCYEALGFIGKAVGLYANREALDDRYTLTEAGRKHLAGEK